MNVYGLMVCRNEGHKALSTISYHMQCQGFSGFFVIDHGSTDGTMGLLRSKKIPNLTVLDRSTDGYLQSEWGAQVRKLIRESTTIQCDALVPVDCDMMWQLDRDVLEQCLIKELHGVLCNNYQFVATERVLRLIPRQEYMEHYWKYLRWRSKEPSGFPKVSPANTKVIMLRRGIQDSRITLHQGDHLFSSSAEFVVDREFNRSLEYPVLSYEDLIRKTVLSAAGNIVACGMEWLRLRRGVASHSAEWFDQLTRTGELHTIWEDFVLSEQQETDIEQHGSDQWVVDESLRAVDFPLF
jgi:hypothetical protein